jgi:hypothetical protein
MRKLILEDDDYTYEISDPNKFSEELTTEDLKAIYYKAFIHQQIQNILDDLVSYNLVEKVNETEESNEHDEDLKYTFNFLEDLLKTRIGVEFNTYKAWCKKEFDENLSEINN